MHASNLRLPGLIEIILGSILAVLLGAVVAATILLLKPVDVLKELPKDTALDASKIYYLAGRKDYTAGQRWRFKRDSLAQGHSVRVTEDELNAWIENIYPLLPIETKAPVKPKAKAKTPAAAAAGADAGDQPLIQAGTPNFRVTTDTLRIGVIYYINVFGYSFQVVTQTAGAFEKPRRGDDPIYFKPSTFYIGSLPVHKLLMLKPLAFGQVVNVYEFPNDLVELWKKLEVVRVENRELVLGMPAGAAVPAP